MNFKMKNKGKPEKGHCLAAMEPVAFLSAKVTLE
jgi:hypothetical protein